MEKKTIKLSYKGKEYNSFSECFNDNRDIARISIPTFVKRIREGMPVEEALKTPKGRTLVTRLGSHMVDGVEFENLPSIARAYGIKESLVYRRHHRGLRGTELIPPKLRKDYVPPEAKPKKPSKWEIDIKGVHYRSLRDACRHLGIKLHTYRNRRNVGYSMEQALGLETFIRPPRKNLRYYEVNGEKMYLNEIAKTFGISATTFQRRVVGGMTPTEAATKPLRRRRAPKKKK